MNDFADDDDSETTDGDETEMSENDFDDGFMNAEDLDARLYALYNEK